MKNTTSSYIAIAAIVIIVLALFSWIIISNNSPGQGETDQATAPGKVDVLDDDYDDDAPVASKTTDAIVDVDVPNGTNLIKNGDAEAGKTSGWDGFASIVPKPHNGSNAFLLKRSVRAFSDGLIPLDPKAKYKLSGFFMAEETPTKAYIGFDCFDANKQRIRSMEVTPIPKSETELVEDAKKGDTVLKIKDGSAWKFEKWTRPYGVVAFEVDTSGAYSDLPNRKITLRGITAITKADGYWEVKLKHPMRENYPAGTAVRQQRSQGAYCWARGRGVVKDKWVDINGYKSGVSVGGQKTDMFWPGTRYIRVAILNLNHSKTVSPNLLVDDVVLEIAPK
jgi:hypothetical protein